MSLEQFQKFSKQTFVEKIRIFHAALHFHAAHKLQHLMKANTNISIHMSGRQKIYNLHKHTHVHVCVNMCGCVCWKLNQGKTCTVTGDRNFSYANDSDNNVQQMDTQHMIGDV